MNWSPAQDALLREALREREVRAWSFAEVADFLTLSSEMRTTYTTMDVLLRIEDPFFLAGGSVQPPPPPPPPPQLSNRRQYRLLGHYSYFARPQPSVPATQAHQNNALPVGGASSQLPPTPANVNAGFGHQNHHYQGQMGGSGPASFAGGQAVGGNGADGAQNGAGNGVASAGNGSFDAEAFWEEEDRRLAWLDWRRQD